MTAADVPAWTQEQDFLEATSSQVRDELEQLVSRNLLGPTDDSKEQLPLSSRGPRDEYLVGLLGPRRVVTSEGSTVVAGASEVIDNTLGGDVGAGDSEGDLQSVLSPQTMGRIWASSMGMSFWVSSRTEQLTVDVSWGTYVKHQRETEKGLRTVWEREPFHKTLEVDCERPEPRVWLVGEAGDEQGVWLDVRVRESGGRRIVRLTLVNGQAERGEASEATWLFQTRLSVRAMDGHEAVFLPIADPMETDTRHPEGEDAHLDLLYRDAVRHCFGHNVAVVTDSRPGERSAWQLTTTWLPTYEVSQVRASGDMADLVTSMDRLAELAESDDPAKLMDALVPMVQGYTAWLDHQEHNVAALPPKLRETALGGVAKARVAADRITKGVRLLRTDPQARLAFGFANRAMALQRRNTATAQTRKSTGMSYREAFALVDGDKEAASWRPFQLGFVLLNLASLTVPVDPERGKLVDLLFFPTGGGKTEAYLGLTAYTFAIRRLQGVVGEGDEARDGGDGVAVLMRYTLRMLTAQQFQRAAALVCATEMLRRDDQTTWGREPFRIGLWVGQSVSPNWYTDDTQNLAQAKQSAGKTRSLQLLTCPWCGAELVSSRDQHEDADHRMVLTFCPESEGANPCPFSRRGSIPDEPGLPVLTVDEYLYRKPPSLLIATVDKLAQLPWYGYAGMLFGRVSKRCPRHGYKHPDLDAKTECKESHQERGSQPAVKAQPVMRLRPPDLIIQDELHLISDSLGTTIGLFESAVDELCSWRIGDQRTGPKIIASTATTKRAAEQVRQLYARSLALFPPQVMDSTDTYFSKSVPVTADEPGRRYLGICAHGWRMKAAEIRLAEILLVAGQTLYDKYGTPADPYMTLVGYFNATRELAGMRRFLDDDVATRIRRGWPARGMSNRQLSPSRLLNIEELTSRINSTDITGVLELVGEPFDPERHTSTRRRQFAAERKAATAAKREPDLPPDPNKTAVDVVLATSMLQVGVDISRFGLMVVTGQPKNTAEYIQASSRVGRDRLRPGLVITLYNWARPRDLAHYEDFVQYHQTFYRRVEALSVTPFSRRSVDRGTAATFIGAVRNISETWSLNRNAEDVDLTGTLVSDVVARMVERADRAAGPRGSSYLSERITALKDLWRANRGPNARQGYEKRKSNGQQLAGLIDTAGEGPWTDLTVGRSMRETENEINLLLPGSGLFGQLNDAPEWNFSSTVPDDAADDQEEESQ